MNSFPWLNISSRIATRIQRRLEISRKAVTIKTREFNVCCWGPSAWELLLNSDFNYSPDSVSKSTVNRSNFWMSCYRLLLKNTIQKADPQRRSENQTLQVPQQQDHRVRMAIRGDLPWVPAASMAAAPSTPGDVSGWWTLSTVILGWPPPCLAMLPDPESKSPASKALSPLGLCCS